MFQMLNTILHRLGTDPIQDDELAAMIRTLNAEVTGGEEESNAHRFMYTAYDLVRLVRVASHALGDLKSEMQNQYNEGLVQDPTTATIEELDKVLTTMTRITKGVRL